MKVVFALLGILSFVAGLLFIGTIRSDIQVQIVVSLVLGGLILMGISTVISRVDRLNGR